MAARPEEGEEPQAKSRRLTAKKKIDLDQQVHVAYPSSSMDQMSVRELLQRVEREQIEKLEFKGDVPCLSDICPNLKSLVIENCNIPHLARVKDLSHLTSLYISKSDFSRDVPEIIFKLKQLRRLKLGSCRINRISERLEPPTGLTELQIFSNYLSGGLPKAVCKFTSLITLRIYNNQLTDLPNALGGLCQLEYLDCSVNFFKSIPKCVFQLRNLKKLDFHNNKKLERIDRQILDLEHLAEFDCSNCPALCSHPAQICQQGLHSIKNWFNSDRPGRLAAPSIASPDDSSSSQESFDNGSDG